MCNVLDSEVQINIVIVGRAILVEIQLQTLTKILVYKSSHRWHFVFKCYQEYFMEKLQLRWVLAQVKSSGRFWQHEDAESYGDPRALKITSGFGNNCLYRGTYLSLNPLVLIYVAFGPCRSDSSCSFLSASCIFCCCCLFVLNWINSPIKKDLLWEVSVKC